MGRVLVLGALNLDLVTRVERHPAPGETVLGQGPERFDGGKGGNQAVAARAGGADVAMVGAVGDDEGGRAYLDRLAARGIDVIGVAVRSGVPTGHALITVSESGENTIVVVPGANETVDTGDLRAAVSSIGPGDVLLTQLEVPLRTVAEAARAAAAAGARVIINAAPFAALPHDVIALADPLVVNEHEAMLLADSGLVPSSLLVTFGAGGAAWDLERVDGQPVPDDEVIDTTGAGDAFCGALAAALAAGADRSRALAVATAAGAAAVRHQGAQPEMQHPGDPSVM
ncbi:ribokinase [Janibacter sp. G1551]|uniref:ribokinase n=1 Tax=Janibacter sp. G1551 TaxID=3420440 RepID=UPI003D021AD5